MPKIKKPERKFVIILSLVLIVVLAGGVTAATIIQGLESRINTFTFGNLTIELTEPEWDKLTEEDRITYPGRSITKDPRVKNTGQTDAYLYLEVRIPRDTIRTVNADQSINAARAVDLFTFKVNSGWTQVGSTTVTADGAYSVYVYAYTAGAVKPGASTPTLFDSVQFVNALEGEPEMGTALEIPLTATGIQSGFLNETGSTIAEKIINAYTISQSQSE